mgnify:CR=1 FL=1
MSKNCFECGRKTSIFTEIRLDHPEQPNETILVCSEICRASHFDKYYADALAQEMEEDALEHEEQNLKDEELKANLERIILTTVTSVDNNRPYKEIEVITAECVFGMNIFRDLFAGFSDAFGGRSKASQKVLRDLRKTCLEELRHEAYVLNADAVIGVDLDYSEFSGGGKSMLFLVASGTAVKFLQDD